MSNEHTTNELAKHNALNQAEIANKLNIVSSRAETLSMIVNILNSFLQVKQNSDNPFSEEIILAFQNAINNENAITNQIFAEVESSINPVIGGVSDNVQIAESTEDTIVTSDVAEMEPPADE